MIRKVKFYRQVYFALELRKYTSKTIRSRKVKFFKETFNEAHEYLNLSVLELFWRLSGQKQLKNICLRKVLVGCSSQKGAFLMYSPSYRQSHKTFRKRLNNMLGQKYVIPTKLLNFCLFLFWKPSLKAI